MLPVCPPPCSVPVSCSSSPAVRPRTPSATRRPARSPRLPTRPSSRSPSVTAPAPATSWWGRRRRRSSHCPPVPCSDPHDSEVYAEMTFQEEEVPGDAVVTELDDYCYGAFPSFVGLADEDSVLEYSLLYPTEVSWEQGDRIGQCVLVHPTELVTGTLEGAAI
ncbi:septum formation family protein [Cellulomonas hominis]